MTTSKHDLRGMARAAVRAQSTTVYVSDVPAGRRRRWFTKAAAYRSAAIARVNAACECGNQHYVDPWERDVCAYCARVRCERRECENRQPLGRGGLDLGPEECGDPSHSYRYRLVARLARWLRWNDDRASGGGAT